MENTAQILTIINEMAPLVLAVIVFAVIIVTAAIVFVRLGPIFKSLFTEFKEYSDSQTEALKVQREAWETLLDRQEKNNEHLNKVLRAEIALLNTQIEILKEKMQAVEAENIELRKLKPQVEALQEKLRTKDEELQRVEAELADVKKELREVSADREKVAKERDDFQRRLQAVEKGQSNGSTTDEKKEGKADEKSEKST